METVNFNEPIYIKKAEGKKKDAVRISSEADIPDFLKNSVHIVDGMLELDCVEGVEHAPLGSVIGYEISDNIRSGINTWHIANAATNLIEKDGVFYTKATIFKAQRIGEKVPAFLEGAPIERESDGSFTITTDWGKSNGVEGEAYFILYGTKKDGTPDANILTKSEKSYDAYYVCTKDGEILGKLSELDPYIKKEDKGRTITYEDVIRGLKYIAEHPTIDQEQLVKWLNENGCDFTWKDWMRQFPTSNKSVSEGMKNGDLSTGASLILNVRDSEDARAYVNEHFLSVDDDISIYHYIRAVTKDLSYTMNSINEGEKQSVDSNKQDENNILKYKIEVLEYKVRVLESALERLLKSKNKEEDKDIMKEIEYRR